MLVRPSVRIMLGCLVLALAGWATACSAPESTRAAIPGTNLTGTRAVVEHVTDGDTVDLAFPGGTERVRLLGIDTPETVKPDTPVQCFGPEASARTKELLPAGTAVVIQRDEEPRDRYGRLLAYVWRAEDGLFINSSLVTDGYARTLSIDPNTAHRAELSADAAQARAAGAGLWGQCPLP